MPEESTTPDLVELSRHAFDAANRNDLDAAMTSSALMQSGRRRGWAAFTRVSRRFVEVMKP